MKLLFSIAIGFCLTGCVWNQDSQGNNSIVSPAMLPVAVGAGLYTMATEVVLMIDFQTSANCSRITPLDTYRFTLTLKDESPQGIKLHDQFISQKALKITDKQLVKGRYEAAIFHQDQTKPLSKKIFSITDTSPYLLMAVPCL